MKTFVYVDGFNFYYGVFSNTVCAHLKWVDLARLFDIVLGADYDVRKVKYFTAEVKDTATFVDRQRPYLRALEETHAGKVEVVRGSFQKSTKRYSAAAIKGVSDSARGQLPPEIKVKAYEEKQSDVNLAVHMLNDVLSEQCRCVALASNDMDLAGALQMVRQVKPKTRIILITPGEGIARAGGAPTRGRIVGRKTMHGLWRHADEKKRIREQDLAQAQFPRQIPNTTIYKPPAWD